MLCIADEERNEVTLVASGSLTREDYERIVPALERRIAERGPLRAIVRLEGFHGWDPMGLVKELEFDVKHRRDLVRIAVVGDETGEAWATRLTAPFFSGRVRFFEKRQAAAAREWVREGC